jgi:predicted nucleic acid-binding protein
MAWVVDTCVLLDIHSADPQFAQSSADCLANHLSDGLVISPVTYVELAPAFEGNTKLQEQFLAEVGVEWPSPWILQDTTNAHRLWFSHIEKNGVAASQRGSLPMCLSRHLRKDFRG